MSSQQIDRIIRTARANWRPPPDITISEWAGRYRYLSPEASAEPGLWNNARAPHLVAPMDRLSPYCETERVVCKFSSQSGKTEAILNFAGYIIDIDPGPILAIQPNVTPMGEAFSKDRISPMLRDSPTLQAKVGQAKGRSSASTITHKTFPGGHLTIAGANSPAGLASRPIRYLVCDEVDRWEITKEGDPLLLARKRLQTFRARRTAKELLVSSPTYDDLGISVEYAKCDQTHEWRMQCQHCGETQFPRLAHFQYDEGNVRSIRYVCAHCGSEHALADEDRVKASGQWVCTKDVGEASIGYWMNQWASPFARWDDTLAEWIDAGNDPAKRQAVTNTVFAEGWEGEGERVDAHLLEQRCETYSADAPAGVVAITIGADVQGDRIEAEIVGWGRNFESWSLGYEVLIGEPTGPEVWQDLADLYRVGWQHEELTDKARNAVIRPSAAMLKPVALCVDSGNWSKQVYDWVKSMRDPSVIPIKGASAFGADAISGTEKDRRRRQAKRMREGRPPEVLGVSQIKRTIMQYLASAPDKPGYCHFPTGRGREYFDQLTGERLMVHQQRGKRPSLSWQKVHAAVEALDCRVYAYAALLLSGTDLSKPVAVSGASAPRKRRKRTTGGGLAPDGWAL
jgi:phage terminase large subunit GpA-like protein